MSPLMRRCRDAFARAYWRSRANLDVAWAAFEQEATWALDTPQENSEADLLLKALARMRMVDAGLEDRPRARP
jgi:hypothetical protein